MEIKGAEIVILAKYDSKAVQISRENVSCDFRKQLREKITRVNFAIHFPLMNALIVQLVHNNKLIQEEEISLTLDDFVSIRADRSYYTKEKKCNILFTQTELFVSFMETKDAQKSLWVPTGGGNLKSCTPKL